MGRKELLVKIEIAAAKNKNGAKGKVL